MLRRIGAVSSLALCAVAIADECATVVQPYEVPIVLAREAAGVYALPSVPEAIQYVPLAFHVVQKNDGSSGIPQAQLDQAMIDGNIAYLPMGVQFCLIKTDVIKNSSWNPLNCCTDTLRKTNVVPNAINIYFTNTSMYCGISSFTFSAVQGIVMANNCTGLPTNHSTFPHEIGHYFDLFHTHESAFGGKECVSGSNCGAAGDLVCDTPADPGLSSSNVSSNCVYTGTTAGPCAGDPPYKPDVTNFMSYSLKHCRDNFTPQQNTRGLATLVNLRPELALVECPKLCPGEITLDGKVDQADLGVLLAMYGKKSMDSGYNPMADLDNDGACGQSDLGILLANYGTVCP